MKNALHALKIRFIRQTMENPNNFQNIFRETAKKPYMSCFVLYFFDFVMEIGIFLTKIISTIRETHGF